MAGLNADDLRIFNRLKSRLIASRPETVLLNDYYEGVHKLQQLGLAIPPELKHHTVCVAWPRVAVDAVEQRLDVTGFRMPGQSKADDLMWDVWQYNNMDERQSFAHLDSLALARSYACVGTNAVDPEYPIITVESPLEMIADRDPRTHHITAALRLYDDGDRRDARATLYLPDVTRWLILVNGNWVDEVEPDVHMLGTPPVVALPNRNRATRRTGAIVEGISEMEDVIDIADSAARNLTNAQLAQETVAAPQKVAIGISKGDFVGSDGRTLPVWESYFGSVWATENSGAKISQLPAADMNNFALMMQVYARAASGVTSLPVEYFGVETQNPPSADGQRAGETRLIKKAERKQVSLGHGWESVMRLVKRFKTGEWDVDARRLETLWRDAGTPTRAQVTDAIVKEYQAGTIDWETAQEEMGRTPETIKRMKQRRVADSALSLGYAVESVIKADEEF